MTPRRSWLPALAAILVLPLLAACGGGGAAPAADAAARGAKLYSRSGCTVCHGPSGRGDGAGAAGLTTPPRDFSKPAEFHAERTPKALAKVIAEGSGNGAMPPYQYLSDRDREDLAAFVLSLANVSP
jgi:high-affinity iron transporter